MSDSVEKFLYEDMLAKCSSSKSKKEDMITEMNSHSNFLYVIKLRYLLECFEEEGKPKDMNRQYWKMKTRKEKWYYLAKSKKNHELVSSFLLSMNNKTVDEVVNVILTISNICNEGIRAFLQGASVDLKDFKCDVVSEAVHYLENLEDEMILRFTIT